KNLVGESAWLYPQTDVFVDLADARARDGGDVRFGISDSRITATTGDRPAMLFTDAGGVAHEIRCEVIVGADGSRSMCRHQLPETQRPMYSKEDPFARFRVLVEAPPSAPELVYTHSDAGFALVSQRTPSMQRLY